MDVCHAIESRRAVRGFTDEPVSRTHLEWVLSAAARAPSGANLQPWNAYVMTGALIPPPPISAIAPSGSPARTRRRATRRSPPTGPVSEHLPPSSAQSTETWARRSGPTSGCICRRSCFCSVMKDCTAARGWRGRSTAERGRRSSPRRTTSSCSAACRSDSRTPPRTHRGSTARHSRRPSPSSTVRSWLIMLLVGIGSRSARRRFSWHAPRPSRRRHQPARRLADIAACRVRRTTHHPRPQQPWAARLASRLFHVKHRPSPAPSHSCGAISVAYSAP